MKAARSTAVRGRAKRLVLPGAIMCAGVLSAPAAVHAQSDAAARYPWMQEVLRKQRAERRSYQQLEAAGFRYVGTNGHSPYVYYVYRRSSDGAEYHCGQDGWKTGWCHPNRPRDPNSLPRHVRIPDLQRAGYRYSGIRQADGKLWHAYDKGCAQPAYLCPNEGFAGCRVVRAAGQC